MTISRKTFGLSALAVLAGGLGLTGRASAQVGPYTIEADVMRGDPNAMGPLCVATSVFYPGDTIVWRAIIRDRSTGVALDERQIAASGLKVLVKMRGAPDVSLHFGSHPPRAKPAESEHYWSGSYELSVDHPVGTLPWSLDARDAQGRSSTFTPIGQNIGMSVLTVVEKPQKK